MVRIISYKKGTLIKLVMICLLTSIAINAQITINYEGSNEIIFNPERGFHTYRSSPLSISFINSLKAQNISVIQRIFIMSDFKNKPLSQSFLNMVENDFNTARAGGVKVNPRFFYSNDGAGIDAPLDIILNHIEQLKPILRANYDVIVLMDAAFIGAWGEWYTSSNGLATTEGRRAVLFALLDVLPVERFVLVRTPDYKRKIFNYDFPLTPEEAFSGINRARTGAHNDCFVSTTDSTDWGTYLINDIEGDKNYLNLDNRFVPQSGETCCNCGWAAGCENAIKELKRMHWSILNKDWNGDVLNRWVNEGCMDEVKKRLGYRLRLIDASIIDSVKPGGIFNMQFRIVNDGFASPFNPRNLEIILRDKSTHMKYRVITQEDPRFWMSGDTAFVDITAGISANMPESQYSAYLFLADPTPRLHNRPEYAIQLANKDIWEDSTGYNYLNHDVEITSNVSGDSYSGDLIFEPYDKTVSVREENSPQTNKPDGIDAYPNPFNNSVVIKFKSNLSEVKNAVIYNILGKRVRTFDKFQLASNTIFWNGIDNYNRVVTSGIYFVVLQTNQKFYTKKLMLIK